jgi:alpha-glucosidase
MSIAGSTASHQEWWRSATIYELYPASFKDSNSDGIGDIPGAIEKVHYLHMLNIDAVWLASCYKSGGVDMGYDVIDYRDIDAQYGTVQDVERFIDELRKRGLRLIMDLVVNHTSDRHSWFEESRRSKSSPKRDWYIWRPGRVLNGERHPPNNWASIFTGSAWKYDEATEEYYLHIFSPHQPDLNWSNIDVRHAVHDDMRFWLDKGVSGFRMDVINILSKVDGLPDAPITTTDDFQPAYPLYCNGPRIHEYLHEMRRDVLDHYPDAMTVGEVIVASDPARFIEYVHSARRELHMAYQYDLFDFDAGPHGKFSTPDPPVSAGALRLRFKTIITKWQTALSPRTGAWGTVWLESHDTARSVTRFGDSSSSSSSSTRSRTAKLLALLQTTLGGTLFLYQGQELGLSNLSADVPLTDYRDFETHQSHDAILTARRRAAATDEAHIDMSDVLALIRLKARDHARAPLPWNDGGGGGGHAGFSNAPGPTWSPMNPDDGAACNVALQDAPDGSVLNFWRRRLRVRKGDARTWVHGEFEAVGGSLDEGPVLAYWRWPVERMPWEEVGEGDRLVVLNLTGTEGVRFQMPPIPGGEERGGGRVQYAVVDGTHEREISAEMVAIGAWITLRAYQGLVFACRK